MFIAPIAHFSAGDAIGLVGITNSEITYTAGAISHAMGGSAEMVYFCPGSSMTAGQVTIASNGAGGTSADLFGFLRGTRITTPSGEVPIEALHVGNCVLTIAGEALPVRWIGTGRHSMAEGGGLEGGPVTVRAGALAEGVPVRDLRMTKRHSLYLDDALIPVENVVNGASITFDTHPEVMETYHLEFDRHVVLIADGAAAESFRDDGNSPPFYNPRPADGSVLPPCAPILSSGPALARLWQRLAKRAGVTPAPSESAPDLHLLADGRRIAPHFVMDGLHVFRLTQPPRSLRIVSRAGVPLALGLSADRRRLGVGLAGIVLRDTTGSIHLGPDAPELGTGFHGPEPGLRWTDGNALLPSELLGRLAGVVSVELYVNATMAYPPLTQKSSLRARTGYQQTPGALSMRR